MAKNKKNDATEKQIIFDQAYDVDGIRIQFLESVGGFASAAEIKFHDGTVVVNTEGLKDAIDAAKAIDTKDFWQYGNNFSIATLELMCASLDVDSSKTGEVNGSKVHEHYWSKGVKEIAEYCEKDVEVLIQIIKKLKDLK